MARGHLDQLWWPEYGVRKRDVLAYYHGVSPVLLPHVRDRPFTLKQHYNGPRSPFRWIKDAPPELPDWIPVAPMPARSRGGEPVRYVLVQDERTLLWLVDFGCIDLHVWTSRRDRPDRPDYVLAETRRFAEIVAGGLVRAAPRLVTAERSLGRRRGVFVDTKMNGHGQQVVSVHSVRPRPAPTVAVPLRWDELTEDLDPQQLTMDVARERVERDGDLFAPLLGGRQRLAPALRRLAA
jgi:bifunctional non-homologous end joining protein LigD